MSNLKTGYYQADNNNGVTFIGDILEDENQDVLPAGLVDTAIETLSFKSNLIGE
jgi:hypothetical protein